MPDPVTIITGIVSAVGGLVGGGGLGGYIQSRRQGKREETQDIWDSFERQIESAEARKDSVEVDRLRREYEAQEEAWRAQQGLAKLTLKEISGETQRVLSTEQVDEFRDLLREAARLSPALLSFAEYLTRGNAYFELGRRKEAADAYDQALLLRPNDPAVLSNIALAWDSLGQHDKALAYANKAVKGDPDNATGHAVLGNVMLSLGRNAEALEAYNEAVERRSDAPGILHNRAAALRRVRRGDDGLHEALNDLNKSLELRPGHLLTLIDRATVHSLLGDTDAGQKEIATALERNPADGEELTGLAEFFAVNREIESALEHLETAISADPSQKFFARTDPDFDNIRDDPRFKELVGEEPPTAEGDDKG